MANNPPAQGNLDLQDASGDIATINADGSLVAVMEEQSGSAGTFAPVRIITKFVQLKAQAITATTPVDVYTPTTGKKFRILGYSISLVTGAALLFEDGTGVEVLRTPVLASTGVTSSGNMGNGILSGAVNTHLFLDATVTTNVSGWIGICEE